KIAYITAGAAGMFCGSCMHDNTLARALIKLGHDVTLVPLYTPIRTDETAIAIDRVFFGGINVYLQQKSALFRWLPRWADRWLNSPTLIRLATSYGISVEAKALGALAVSMLQGSHGQLKKEVESLAAWLANDVQPDIINFSNMLMAGSIPEIKRQRNVPIVVTLQGDDIFLNDLIEPYKSQALAEIKQLDASVDAYLVNSDYYADHMAKFLDLPRAKFFRVPLGIDVQDLAEIDRAGQITRPPTIGYLARLAPEKGLHLLVDAFLQLKEQPGLADARLHVAGWLGAPNKPYAEAQFAKVRAAGHGAALQYHGEVDRAGKLAFLREIDLLSVPTTYREPKGLFVLEALAAGVPVVQPDHGAFPELLASTGGGRLVRANDAGHLAEELASLLNNPVERAALAQAGRAAVLDHHHAQTIAQQTITAFERLLKQPLPTLPASVGST
ncbi:MAG TPA: glycosyltransferase family 4 protein, partial [Pirellulaceae bacterium]|nr:glycosyltransferase family 4 protein [Pirellulaceae bacterium]